MLYLKAASKEKVVAAFKKFDKNGDGVIDWEEFQQVRIETRYDSALGYLWLMTCLDYKAWFINKCVKKCLNV